MRDSRLLTEEWAFRKMCRKTARDEDVEQEDEEQEKEGRHHLKYWNCLITKRSKHINP